MTKYREILRLQSLGFSERNIAHVNLLFTYFHFTQYHPTTQLLRQVSHSLLPYYQLHLQNTFLYSCSVILLAYYQMRPVLRLI